MRSIIAFLILLLLFSCRKEKAIPSKESFLTVNDSLKTGQPLDAYQSILYKYHSSIKNASIVKKRNAIFDIMFNTMPQYWVGTDWDYNGISRVPKEGSIACGYFVTNLLDDLGFSIKRVLYAQQPSSVMIHQLSNKESFGTAHSIDQMKKKILTMGIENDIFILGLDQHTGFILKNKNVLYFFHADYVTDQVQFEKIKNSRALKQSQTYMFGSILQNDNLIKTIR